MAEEMERVVPRVRDVLRRTRLSLAQIGPLHPEPSGWLSVPSRTPHPPGDGVSDTKPESKRTKLTKRVFRNADMLMEDPTSPIYDEKTASPLHVTVHQSVVLRSDSCSTRRREIVVSIDRP